MKKKTLALLVAVVVVVGCVIGGTVAWLTARSEPVVNTFTYGDINIELQEDVSNEEPFKILPGNNIEKDPYVIVKANSEACWLFVKIEEDHWPSFMETDRSTRKVRYEVADGWTALDGSNVYYRGVDATENDTTKMYILKDNQVIVSDTLTKGNINSINTQPKLTFTAYAVQRDENITTAQDAWANVNSAS